MTRQSSAISPARMSAEASCPVCARGDLEILLTHESAASELALRHDFFSHRINGPQDAPDLKDRTDVLHATASSIRICRACGVLVREPDGREFDDDSYAPFVMEKMLRAYIDAYRRKERVYRPLLQPGAEIVEVGSYVGGFLHVAGEWGWNAVGVDVGADTAQFTASHSYQTCRGSLAECGFADASRDGVFIWTCFEQIDDVRGLVRDSKSALRSNGVLVIRTPNALFYAACEAILESARASGRFDERDPIVQILAWNNLLGFPYRYGFGPRSLDRLVCGEGFDRIAHYGDTLMAPLHFRMTASARQEEDAANAGVASLQSVVSAFDPEAIAAPWFEAVYRKVD